MEIHQLRYFVAVAEAGSFSRAAERCRVAQPSLSQQIKKLETALGQDLFDRLPRGAALTKAGHALLPRARRILAEVREARGELERDLDEGRVPLAVGAIPTMAPYVLPPVLRRLTTEAPDCELTVREDLTERLVEALLDLELDCAIMSTPVEHRSVEVEVLGSERLLLAVHGDVTLPASAERALETLRNRPSIVLHEMHCLGQQIRDFCDTTDLAQRIVCRSTQIGTVRHLVALGMGYSLIPEMAARFGGSNGLRYAPMPDRDPRREVAVVWHRDRSRSRLARRFVELVREDLAAGRHRVAME
ncbi:MAG: LysR family transcriptional regulator [Acidobacteriota bacterium]|jgi:LysR family hydrogen peroxide-inducible transcriptional activator